MRVIKKIVTVSTFECIVYDRTSKEEKTITANQIKDIDSSLALPDNCILIDKKHTTDAEVTYTMKPEVFFANATIE